MKYSNIAIILTAMMIVSFSMESCTKNTNEADVVVNTSTKDTWTIIKDNILTPSCATSGCHASTSDATYAQHNLLLTSATAYDNLLNIISKNTAAKAVGLVRVKPGDYSISVLFQKIDC